MLLPEVRLAPRRRARSNRSYSEISGKVEEEGDGDIVGGCLLGVGEVGIVLRLAAAASTTSTTSASAASAVAAAMVVVAALQVGARNKGSLREGVGGGGSSVSGLFRSE